MAQRVPCTYFRVLLSFKFSFTHKYEDKISTYHFPCLSLSLSHTLTHSHTHTRNQEGKTQSMPCTCLWSHSFIHAPYKYTCNSVFPSHPNPKIQSINQLSLEKWLPQRHLFFLVFSVLSRFSFHLKFLLVNYQSPPQLLPLHRLVSKSTPRFLSLNVMNYHCLSDCVNMSWLLYLIHI